MPYQRLPEPVQHCSVAVLIGSNELQTQVLKLSRRNLLALDGHVLCHRWTGTSQHPHVSSAAPQPAAAILLSGWRYVQQEIGAQSRVAPPGCRLPAGDARREAAGGRGGGLRVRRRVPRLAQPEGRRRAHDDGVRGDMILKIWCKWPHHCANGHAALQSPLPLQHQKCSEASGRHFRASTVRPAWMRTCQLACCFESEGPPVQISTAQAGRRGPFSRWLARYKRRMDYKMLAIGDGEQLLRWHWTEAASDNICKIPPPNGASHTTRCMVCDRTAEQMRASKPAASRRHTSSAKRMHDGHSAVPKLAMCRRQ